MSSDQDDATVRYLRFGSFAAPVRFDGCEDLIAAIRSIFPSWDISESLACGDRGPIIRFRKRDGRFLWYSKRLPPPLSWERRKRFLRVKDTAADFHYVFFDWYTSERPNHFFMHSAAVEMAGQLVIFPSTKRAGKSTLMAELVRRGHRVFCDDVLIFDPERRLGVGLGIMPRPRMPLPDNLTEDQRRFMESHFGLCGKNSVYLKLAEPAFADYGSTAPIGAMVFLDRQDSIGKATMQPVGRAEALSRLIRQNSPESFSPSLVFDTLSQIVSTADPQCLRYTTLTQAADLLEQTFDT